MSAKTGFALHATTTFAVASNVNAGMTTSSPGLTLYAMSEVCRAAVPELTAIACFTPTWDASFLSNSLTFFPPSKLASVRRPLSRTPLTAVFSFSPRTGLLIGMKPIVLSLLGRLDFPDYLSSLRSGPSPGPSISPSSLRH